MKSIDTICVPCGLQKQLFVCVNSEWYSVTLPAQFLNAKNKCYRYIY